MKYQKTIRVIRNNRELIGENSLFCVSGFALWGKMVSQSFYESYIMQLFMVSQTSFVSRGILKFLFLLVWGAWWLAWAGPVQAADPTNDDLDVAVVWNGGGIPNGSPARENDYIAGHVTVHVCLQLPSGSPITGATARLKSLTAGTTIDLQFGDDDGSELQTYGGYAECGDPADAVNTGSSQPQRVYYNATWDTTRELNRPSSVAARVICTVYYEDGTSANFTLAKNVYPLLIWNATVNDTTGLAAGQTPALGEAGPVKPYVIWQAGAASAGGSGPLTFAKFRMHWR